MRSRAVLAFVVTSVAFVACGESHAKPRSGDGTLVLEVGGEQASLREALRAAGVEVTPPVRSASVQEQPQEPPASSATPPREERPPQPSPEPPTVQPQPEPAFSVVEMKAGDSLILLARRHLGNGNRFRDLLTLNGWTEQDALSLRPGTKVKIPRRAAAGR